MTASIHALTCPARNGSVRQPCTCEVRTFAQARAEADLVNHPPHYTSHPSGVECIQVTEHMGFNLGNAVKYIWRADLKSGTAEGAVEDLRKATWYLERELQRRTGGAKLNGCRVNIRPGWRCIRGGHPAGTPCALVPKWWNLRGWWWSR